MKQYRKSLSARDIIGSVFVKYDLSKEWREAIGPIGEGVSMIVWGDSGSGKTTFCLKLALELCRFGKVYYNSMEQGKSDGFKEGLKRLDFNNIPASKVSFGNRDSWEDCKAKIRYNKARFVILDSIDYLKFTAEDFKLLTERYKKRTFIVVSHGDKYPKSAHADEIRYMVDVKIKLKHGVATADSRLGSTKPMQVIPRKNANGTLSIFNNQ
jgi:hypothetical protein